MTPSKETIETAILELLADMTSDWDLEQEELGGQTRLSADLGFSSVDMLELLAGIDMKYRRKLRYDRLILREGRYINELTVENLAVFVHENFDVHDAGPVAM